MKKLLNINILICSLLMRMIKKKKEKISKEIIYESWEIINRERPNWKKNKYLKRMALRNIYLKIISKSTLKIMMLLIK